MWRWGRLRACGTPSASSPLCAVPYGSRKQQAARQGRGRASRSCLYRLAGCCCALVLIALIWPHQVPNHKLLAISELNDVWSRGRRKTYLRCVCNSGRTRFFVRSRSRQRPDTASGECCPQCPLLSRTMGCQWLSQRPGFRAKRHYKSAGDEPYKQHTSTSPKRCCAGLAGRGLHAHWHLPRSITLMISTKAPPK